MDTEHNADSPQHRSIPIDGEVVRELINTQKQELLIKQEELAIRRQEIESNERLACKSIDAQRDSDMKRGEVFQSVYNKRFYTWIAAIVAMVIVAVVAMFTSKTEVAIEMLKIGGPALLAYFSGVNKGKNQVLENREAKNQD